MPLPPSGEGRCPIRRAFPSRSRSGAALAGFLDFLTVFFAGGYVIGALTGNLSSEGFKLEGWPALLLFAVTVLYFYLGWHKLGGTIWQRILKAR